MRDEVFNDHSFKQSRMYAKGVTCGDCHDPHSGKLKAARGEVCAPCHQPERFAARSHTGHPPAPGAPDCVSCHMPARTYMVVDVAPRPLLPHPAARPVGSARHAQRLQRLPRGQVRAWAAAAVERWHGPQRKGFQTYAEPFQWRAPAIRKPATC